MSKYVWRNFSGAPAAVIPQTARHLWTGMWEPADDADPDPSDLILQDGSRFQINDQLDFENPITMYDHVCSRAHRSVGCFLWSLGSEQAVVVDAASDNYGWCCEHLLLVGDQTVDNVEDHEWCDVGRWELREPGAALLNTTMHGGDPDLGPDDFIDLDIDAGRYVVRYAQLGKYGPIACQLRRDKVA